ncbi:MAG: diguanylate cyclase [Rhodocyclaceae bacterium]
MDISKFEQLRLSGELPSPRGVALSIISLTRQPEVSIAELARVISGDPGFVGRLNNAGHGLIANTRRPVASVHEALMVLGLPAVRTMAMGFSLLSDYRSGRCAGFEYERFWSYSLALAVAMQVFAQRSRAAAADEMFSLGLLTRIGELALATIYPQEYGEIIARAADSGTDEVLAMEREAFAMTHAELGMAMLSDWGLPDIFVRLAGFFDRPDEEGLEHGSRLRKLVKQLSAARCAADICTAGDDEQRRQLMPLLLQAGARLDIAHETLIEDANRVARLWAEWLEALRFPPAAVLDFDRLDDEPQAAASGQVGPAGLVDAAQSATPDAFVEMLSVRHPDHLPDKLPNGGVCVLVVGSADAATKVATTHLDALGHEAQRVDNLTTGLELALSRQPQIVLLIDETPEADAGLDFVRSLRGTRVGKRMYVLLAGRGESDEAMAQAFEAGVDDYCSLPLREAVFAARLQAALRVVALQGELEHERAELRRFAAELSISNRRLSEAALTDALTGFYNRRYADERMLQEWMLAEREREPLSCMVIDFDALKAFNDRHGHDAGDLALKAAADALRGALRGQDVICRIGGDEFLTICPRTTLEAALTCAYRLRDAVRAVELPVEGAAVRLSVSIGVASCEPGTGTPEALIKVADRGAYLAKARGRDGVVAVQRE